MQFDDPEKPIFFYINSTGTSWYDGETIGYETEAFAICDTMQYIKPPIHTICLGQAMGTAAMILSSGAKGFRASLPHATITLSQSRTGAQGQATDIQIRAKEAIINKIYNQTLTRTYINPRGDRIMLSIAYGRDQSDALQMHKPELCYPAQGFRLLNNQRGTLD